MHSYFSPVVTTFERCGLDPEQAVLFGGSVLALHGLRRARDVDLMVPESVFRDIEQAGQLPNGQPVVVNYTRLTTPNRVASNGLPIDLWIPYDFEHELEEAVPLTMGELTIHHISLRRIGQAKLDLSLHNPRAKDYIDAWKIKRRLRSIEG